MAWNTNWSWLQKVDVIGAIITKLSAKGCVKALKRAAIDNHLWVLAENVVGMDKGTTFIKLYLLSKDGARWSYREAEKACIGKYKDCPAAFVNKVTKAKQVKVSNIKDKRLSHISTKINKAKKVKKVIRIHRTKPTGKRSAA